MPIKKPDAPYFNLRRMLAAAVLLAAPAKSPAAQIEIENAFVNLAFDRPVDLQAAADGSDRLFVVEQAGRIFVFDNEREVPQASLFLDIRDRVNDAGNEEGLLGLAFHPEYESNGYFYVDYTAANPRRTVIARYSANPANAGEALRESEAILLEVPQPFQNHNGGQIAFGPDSMLYIALGDGGGAGDPAGNGQNRSTLLGAILRIDVDTRDGARAYGIPADNPFAGNASGYREEIYAYGLRNPWRFCFDSETGTMWAADVGQNRTEEIDIIEKGANYGWNIMEGSDCYSPPGGCNTAGLTLPVWEYGRALGQSVTGGYVYRGTLVPELNGRYIFADYVTGRIWATDSDGLSTDAEQIVDSGLTISSFGADEHGELYICTFDGSIYRFKPTVTAIDDETAGPRSFELFQNYPNPFNAGTRIRYRLETAGDMEMAVFSITGRRVRTLADGLHEAGAFAVDWDGRSESGRPAASGVYLLRMRTATGTSRTIKMLMLR